MAGVLAQGRCERLGVVARQDDPKAAPKAAPQTAPQPALQPAAPVAGGYTVKPGETLSSIASAQNVAGGWQSLSTKNGLPNANVIHPGQVLRVS